MSVKIKPLEKAEKYEVNGKEVYLDSNGNWIATKELTINETQAFQNYRKLIINNAKIKIHPNSTYKR